jgi:hypothetical protein
MSDTITYQYKSASALNKSGNSNEFFLAKYGEIEKKEVPCFFWGKLTDPYTTARCLIALSNVVQSSFNLSPFETAKLKDPIVTAGNEKNRFEGFSHCAVCMQELIYFPMGMMGNFWKMVPPMWILTSL